MSERKANVTGDGGGGGGGALRFTFGRKLKIKSRDTIDTLYKTGRKRSHHPLVAHGLRRADNGPSRIAISIGRACGNAVQRNTIKRKLRESYRLIQHEVPPGSDYLLVVRPHKVMELAGYQERLRQLLRGELPAAPEGKPARRGPRRGKGKGAA